jgi:hypothetical protein
MWLTTVRGDQFIPKYQPLYPALLSLDRNTHSLAILAIIAALTTFTVGALAHSVGADRITACWLWTLSPLALVQNSLFLPYTLSLALGMAACISMHKESWASKRAGLTAGSILGLGLLVRPFDAMAFALWACLTLRTRGHGDFYKRLSWSLAGLVVPVALALTWNLKQTGSAFHFPFTLTSSHDTWGFGLRKIYDDQQGFIFTPAMGLVSVGLNAIHIATWITGGLSLLWITWIKRDRIPRQAWSISAVLIAVWAAAYGPFYGAYTAVTTWRATDLIGPFYWLPVAVGVCVIASEPVRECLTKGKTSATDLSLLTVWTCSVMVVVLARNVAITNDWRQSDLWKVARASDTTVVLDKTYTEYVGAPNPVAANEDPRNPTFVLDWSTAAKLWQRVGYQHHVVLAVQVGKPLPNQLPRIISARHVTSFRPVRIRAQRPVTVQVQQSRRCRWLHLTRGDTLSISSSGLPNGLPCSADSSDALLTVKVHDIKTGDLIRNVQIAEDGGKGFFVSDVDLKSGGTSK